MNKYPIYNFEIYWFENDFKGGRKKNSTSFRKMFKRKDEMPLDELIALQINYWKKYRLSLMKKKRNRNLSTPVMWHTFLEFEEWCLEWFQHMTFDVGQTDEKALLSFRQFVTRKIDLNHANGYFDMISPPINADTKKYPFYCLMGAEDEWRWKGGGDNLPAPCRCKHCKKLGILRIGH